jgi:hypothetical protein
MRDGLRKNFTVTIISLGNVNIFGTISTSRVGLYANNTYIVGEIDTSGKGCLAGDGIARGKT